MSLSSLTGARRFLVNQLVYFDEQYSIFLDTYVPTHGKERLALEKLVQRYLRALESVLSKEDGELAKELNRTVFLGSSVKVRYQEDQSEETFIVVFPTMTDPDRNRVSMLSPIGRQLLLKSTDDRFNLETPYTQEPVAIEEVKMAYLEGFD